MLTHRDKWTIGQIALQHDIQRDVSIHTSHNSRSDSNTHHNNLDCSTTTPIQHVEVAKEDQVSQSKSTLVVPCLIGFKLANVENL
jgi:hypothetical protein